MYTFILLSARRNSVRQHAISQGRLLIFFCLILALFLTAISGIGYGIFQKYQRNKSETELQASAEEIKKLVHGKLQVELELAAVNEEMNSIRRMAEKIQEALGILGQGGGDSSMQWNPEDAEGQANSEQENISTIADVDPHAHETLGLITPSILKQEVQPLYNYVSEHQKQIDGYPSILPVELQKREGEKHAFWYSSRFGWRIHPLTRKREFHQGLDIKTHAGVPVIAAADGTILKAKRDGYLGKTVEISHDGHQFKTLYAHLKDYADGIKVGQKVTRGQIIGYVGNTGRSTGAHLHYAVYDENKKRWVNPLAYVFDQQPTFSP